MSDTERAIDRLYYHHLGTTPLIIAKLLRLRVEEVEDRIKEIETEE